jgi:hypothetical protein
MPAVASGNVIRVALWVGVALAFGVWVAVARGATAAAEYYAAYLLELSLSVDNIFVFVIVFSELHIPAENQRRRVEPVGKRRRHESGQQTAGSQRTNPSVHHAYPLPFLFVAGRALPRTLPVSGPPVVHKAFSVPFWGAPI